MEVKIIRSPRRRRTVSARMIKDTIVVRAPAVMAEFHLERIIADFKARFQRKQAREELNKAADLESIAKRFNKRYFGGSLKLQKIAYVTDQKSKFGCCICRSATIRISHRLSSMPAWVRDYVIVHEMAHLIEPNHSQSFWDIVSRYELAERAKGYLMAAGLQAEDGPDNDIEEGV